MGIKPFGIKELNVMGDSGTPQIQSVDNLFLRVGSDKTVVIGSENADFQSPAPTQVVSTNDALLNVGIITANSVYADNINVSGGGGGGGGTLLIVPAGNYIDWQDTDGDSCVRITGEADNDFLLENKSDNTQRIRISSDGSTRLRSELNLNLAEAKIGDGSQYVAHLQNPKNDIGDTVGLAFACSSSDTTIGASIYLEREDTHSRGYLAFATKDTTYTTGVKERMRITQDGHIGIGTTNPTASNVKDALDSNNKVLAVGILTCNEFYGSISGDTGLNGNVEIDGALTVTGDITAFYSSSDIKLKDNITPIENSLSKVVSISGNTFNWNEHSEFEGQGDTGVVAQEIESLGLPGIVKEQVSGHKSVQYHKLVPLLIEAIKELEGRVSLLEK